AKKRSVNRVGDPPMVTQIELPYRQWDGHIGPWSEHFGKASKQVYPLDGGPPERSCNEVEVAKLLRTVRQEAFWVCSYAPSKVPDLWRPWSIDPRNLPDWLKKLDKDIRAKLTTKTGGIPDVAAWDDDRPLETIVFIECKGPKEDIKEGQEDWLSAALGYGLSESNFAVAVRPFV
ncbi:MAG: VRR-NUC domain-containing protein, partial [Rubrobacteraceae bacterium]